MKSHLKFASKFLKKSHFLLKKRKKRAKFGEKVLYFFLKECNIAT